METESPKYEFPANFYAPAPEADRTTVPLTAEVSNKLTQALNGIQLASGLGESQEIKDNPFNSPTWQLYRAASFVSAPVCAYHGYKRNNSIAWALWWSLMGGLFPIFTPVIAVAQGFGKEKK